MPEEKVDPQAVILIAPASAFAGGPAVLEDAVEALQDLGKALSSASQKFWSALALSGAAPDEIELGLEFAFDGKGKWLVVEAGASAKASVKLKWTAQK